MKVIAILLGLAAAAQAGVQYHLKCTSGEIGVFWPSYYSNSEYYVCPGIGARQLTMECNPGELFSFILQQCTGPSMFIPPPAIEALPTVAPIVIIQEGMLPMPAHTEGSQPPIISGEHPVPNVQHPEGPAIINNGIPPTPPTLTPIEVNEEPSGPLMPPTPAPTPPRVQPHKPVPGPQKPSKPKAPSAPNAPQAAGKNKKPSPTNKAKATPVKKQPPQAPQRASKNPTGAGRKPTPPKQP